MERICQVCEKTFEAERVTAKFCSAACRMKFKRLSVTEGLTSSNGNVTLQEKVGSAMVCLFCEKEFPAERSTAKFCSTKCRVSNKRRLDDARVYQQRGGICDLCDKPLLPNDFVEKDHIIQRRDGGTDDDSNVRIVHLACHAIRHRRHAKNVSSILSLLTDVTVKYNELIMAVQSKFPGETRHETALRYIRQAEDCARGLVLSAGNMMPVIKTKEDAVRLVAKINPDEHGKLAYCIKCHCYKKSCGCL